MNDEDLLAHVHRCVQQNMHLDNLSEKFAAAGRMQLACRDGDLFRAQMLAEYFSLTPQHARLQGNIALRWACANGHLDVAQWLVSTFRLQAHDAADSDGAALFWAIQFGHAHVVHWLAAAFGVTPATVLGAIENSSV